MLLSQLCKKTFAVVYMGKKRVKSELQTLFDDVCLEINDLLINTKAHR